MEQKKFLHLNILLLLVSSLLIFYGINGSIQERLLAFSSFSISSLKILVQTAGIITAGFCFFLVFFKIAKVSPLSISSKKKLPLLITGWIFYFMSISLLLAKRWAEVRFPMEQPDIIFFNILNYKGENIDTSIFLEAARIIFTGFIIALCFFLAAFFLQIKSSFNYLSTRIIKKININLLYFIFGSGLFLLSVYDICSNLHAEKYLSFYKEYSQPVEDSEFYLSEYVTPEYKNIVFPEKKKNLIIILMESMESSFADKEAGGVLNKNLIPQLTRYASENINFSNTDLLGGGIDLSGTGWTIAGMTAKFAGLPYNLWGNENQECISFLPGAVTLNDILAQNGYNQLFLFGSDKHFGGRDALLETHGNVEIHDIEWYKEHDMLAKDYSVFWGFEDSKLYNFAKYELDNISKNNSPFMLGLLTVDTHMPDGYQCPDCPLTEDMPLKNSILCADTMLNNFLEWCKLQSWYEDTVIVIAGDHLFLASPETNPFGDNNLITLHRLKDELDGMEGNPRRWIDIFINASPMQKDYKCKNRKFSSFDMFPTILAAMGCEIKGEKLGFGVNLFSKEKTLCERFDEEYINYEIMKRNRQYEEMEFRMEAN